MPETEIKARRKCPHCGLPLDITVDLNLSQSATVRLKGAAPVKGRGTEKPEEEPQVGQS